MDKEHLFPDTHIQFPTLRGCSWRKSTSKWCISRGGFESPTLVYEGQVKTNRLLVVWGQKQPARPAIEDCSRSPRRVLNTPRILRECLVVLIDETLRRPVYPPMIHSSKNRQLGAYL